METSKDYKNYVLYILLAGAIALLIWAGGQARYALCTGSDGAYVLDTRTGQLWLRHDSYTLYLGTNENPRRQLKHVAREPVIRVAIPKPEFEDIVGKPTPEDIKPRPRFEDIKPILPFEDIPPATGQE